MKKSFKDLGLSDDLLQTLEKMGFEHPTPIQEESIGYLLEHNTDLIGLAQTGTGKTAAFSLPILDQVDLDNSKVQALILSPTRELCLQIARDIEEFSAKQKVKTLAVYGGSDIKRQIKALKDGRHIVVGTPGRTLDLIERKKLKVNHIRFLVLDEADEMLSMGFQESLDGILETTPEEKQTILFSATMPKGIRRITKKYMNEPHEISVLSEAKSATNVEHEVYMTNERNRYQVLKRLADINTDMYGIVFCRTRRETQMVADYLMHDGYNSDTIHGDLSQSQRDQVMRRFREKKIQLLVATDVAARGIDVNDLTHVINYNLPDSLETYVHRSGRTGRANKEGICITIINAREKRKIRILEDKIDRKIEFKKIPSGDEITRTRLLKLISDIEKVEVPTKELGDVLPEVYLRLEAYSKEELIDRFVSMEFNRFIEYYRNAQDLNANAKKSRDDREDRGDRRDGKGGRNQRDRRGGRAEQGFSRFFITIGKEHKVNPKEMITLINQSMPGKKLDIGNITLKKEFSYFEIEEGYEELVIKSLRGQKFRGKKINVEMANEETGGRRKKSYKGVKKKKKKRKSKS